MKIILSINTKDAHFLTCSIIEDNRPKARPLPSSLVMTALPSLTTSLLAYFN